MPPFIMHHQTILALVSYYTASAFIGSLPAPGTDSSQFYQFLFKFLNTLGGNLFRAFSPSLPVAQNKTTAESEADIKGPKT